MRVLVTGAGGLLGELAADGCERAGMAVIRSARSAAGADRVAWDMAGGALPAALEPVDCLVHTAPIWLLPDNIEPLAARGLRRVVCFGSTSVLTKTRSPEAAERRLAGQLEDAERSVRERASDHGVAATIFRPTMIYGHGRDRNISTIARFVRRFGFFPVAGDAAGRRQPVYAGDLAAAARDVLGNDRTFDGTYELAGSETLTYHAMVQRIFHCLGRRERIIRVPPVPYRALLALAGRLGYGVNAAMVDRMAADMDFDCSRAMRDFGYTAEPFLAHPERDLRAP